MKCESKEKGIGLTDELKLSEIWMKPSSSYINMCDFFKEKWSFFAQLVLVKSFYNILIKAIRLWQTWKILMFVRVTSKNPEQPKS